MPKLDCSTAGTTWGSGCLCFCSSTALAGGKSLVAFSSYSPGIMLTARFSTGSTGASLTLAMSPMSSEGPEVIFSMMVPLLLYSDYVSFLC